METSKGKAAGKFLFQSHSSIMLRQEPICAPKAVLEHLPSERYHLHALQWSSATAPCPSLELSVGTQLLRLNKQCFTAFPSCNRCTNQRKKKLPYYFLRTGYLLQAIPVHRNKQKEEKLDEKRPSRVITIKAARSISSRSRKKFALLALRPPRFSAQGGSRKNKAEAERPRGARAHQATPGRRRRDSRGYNRWRRKHGGGLVMRLGGATRHGFGTPTPLPGKPSCRGGQLAATWGSPRPCSYS